MTDAPLPAPLFARLVLAACLPLCAQAATPEPVDDAALRLDQNIQALKAEVLDINQRALGAEQSFLYPGYSRVTVYLGNKIPGLLLNSVSITIDDGTPTRRDYDQTKAQANEAIVLQRKGLQRILRLNATPGAHRIHAEFSAHLSDAKLGTPPITGRYEAVFEKTEQPAELELSILQDGYLSAPKLTLRDWRAAP